MTTTVSLEYINTDGTHTPINSVTPLPVLTSSTLSGTSDLTPATAAIVTATTTSLVTATALQTIKVYRITLNVAGANVLTFKSGTTQLREPLNFTAAGFLVYDFYTRPWMTTAVNEALNLTTSTTAAVNVTVEYVKSV